MHGGKIVEKKSGVTVKSARPQNASDTGNHKLNVVDDYNADITEKTNESYYVVYVKIYGKVMSAHYVCSEMLNLREMHFLTRLENFLEYKRR